MTTAFVVMTALPPTRGHLQLLRFAAAAADRIVVIVGTQPGEPYVDERVAAIRAAARRIGRMRVDQLHRTLPQRPNGDPGFWTMWRGFLRDAGCREGDLIVASEPYGQDLASATGCRFIPYDYAREVVATRGTRVREDPIGRFADLMPEFQPVIRRRVTVIGAESTGKTTLSTALAGRLGAHWTPEWARPYLEHLDTVRIDNERMRDIWRGQRALQTSVQQLEDRPFIVQDTDLWATVGYWDHWDPGATPAGLVADASADRSDLYLVTRANIPFEPDPQRYGGDRRETPDGYWTDLLERHALPFEVLDAAHPDGRLDEAEARVRAMAAHTIHLDYARIDND